MANVAPGINYPDPPWQRKSRIAVEASTTVVFGGVPAPNGVVGTTGTAARNDVNSYNTGGAFTGSNAAGKMGVAQPVYGGATMPVVQFALTFIQNQASG